MLLGALINYILDNELYFKEYVVAYTNAATLVSEEFQDTEDLDGLFSGYDPRSGKYDPATWAYASADGERRRDARHHRRSRGRPRARRTASPSARAGDEHGVRWAGAGARPGAARRDAAGPAARSSRSSSGTTPATPRRWCRDACGISVGRLRATSRDAVTENSGRERTTCLVYAVGWTQHTLGAQFIRTAAIMQLLLGNMGRPGGGIMALRGHASIQGSTDIPTLFNLLPGYLPMPKVGPARHAATTTSAAIGSQGAEGLLGQRRRATPSACSRRGGATRRPPRTTGPSTTCRG